jgi:hypothetical protein
MGEEEARTQSAWMPWHVCWKSGENVPELEDMSAVDVKRRLALLYEERGLAKVAGLANDPAYMADLNDEIATMRAAWTGAAVTEIASMRSQLYGRLSG